jgi:hypothetical protein
MRDLKLFKLLIFVLALLYSCKEGGKNKDKAVREKMVAGSSIASEQTQLLPYSAVYPYDPPHDTTLTNGAFLLHLVNRDTSDKTLYIQYGNKQFDSLFVIEYGLELAPCHHYEVCYATDNNIAIVFQCTNSRGMTILPLSSTKPVVEYLNPLYIGAKEGFTVSLMKGDDDVQNGDSLLVADLDYEKKQYIKIHGLVCGDKIHCFDDVKVKDGKLYLTYTGAVPEADPETINQIVPIDLR